MLVKTVVRAICPHFPTKCPTFLEGKGTRRRGYLIDFETKRLGDWEIKKIENKKVRE